MVRLTMCREANEVYEETSLVHQSSICRQMELFPRHALLNPVFVELIAKSAD